MKRKLLIYKYLTCVFAALSIATIYFTFKLGPQLGGRIYQIGIFLFIIFIVISSNLFDKSRKFNEILYLISSWPNAYDSKFDFNKIHKFYYEYGPKSLNENTFHDIDDQTAHDLNVDEVFKKISNCSSTPGEQMLYYILRTPKTNSTELIERNKIIDKFKNDENLRSTIQQIFSNLGKQRKGEIFNLFNTETVVNKSKVLLYNLIALSSVVALVWFIIDGADKIPTFIGIFAIYMFISLRTASEIEYELTSLQYLGDFIRASKELSKIDDPTLKDEIDKIKERVDLFSKIDKKTLFIYSQGALDIFIETINALFLTRIRSYYSIINIIKKNRQELMELYALVGKIEAYISVSSYRTKLKNYSLPNFTDNKNNLFKIENACHPLLEDGIPNSINLNNKGVILTGSNMSGKSTFMRTLALNMLLAQSIYTCLCDDYNASFFRVMSSLSISDDVLSGTSYYLEECNAVLRILNSLDEEVPAFCIIDEIFKGTNPIERIATSKQILKYIMNRNALSIVATHDLELAETCNDKYLKYYFCEDVDENEGLIFDFKLKEGICNTGNAIKLLSYLGYPNEIINDSIKDISSK
ncbi:DNA mismatch repair protein MutS [Clostridium tertium]|uniref:DNA mismatch repair protein MutS n=1 Tax=Clostridium tertium TaxID=1559 RepID=A0A9X4AZ20_9CLOT|nr:MULTISPECIES: DNA mismatch repair protein MutS [Clostridium]MDB1940038.1 DNA mismatch repair protein MutS [Clostridium tertium]MDB1948475.1 DNA mismatch repair protein MutS [Clostridium tertium]MDB1954795.1 DNA mismatch repair protein MutS [Clostridium tertium]MDB1959089.1 DNA mismatch repair protein MutS [Clostridium tertium]MDB1963047.1 DNA mismatch repair protein MutS [Clostridium tertium]